MYVYSQNLNRPVQKLTWVPQISLERMDEIFGTADFSRIEDVGIAAKLAAEEEKEHGGVEHGQATVANKV